MKKPYTAAAGKLITVVLTYMISLSVVGQGVGSVVESQGINLGNQSRSSSNSDALSLLLEQNQQLRAEVQALRGIVEEQGFELRKMQRDSLNRYTSTDNRLSALESGSSTGVPAPYPLPPHATNQESKFKVLGQVKSVP